MSSYRPELLRSLKPSSPLRLKCYPSPTKPLLQQSRFPVYAMASLSVSTPIKPSFLSSSHHRRNLKPRPLFAASKRTSYRIQALSSSSEFFSPFLTALEAPVHAGMEGRSDPQEMLMGERIVFLGGEITEFMADVVLTQLILLDAQDHSKDIRLYINSSGGSLR